MCCKFIKILHFKNEYSIIYVDKSCANFYLKKEHTTTKLLQASLERERGIYSQYASGHISNLSFSKVVFNLKKHMQNIKIIQLLKSERVDEFIGLADDGNVYVWDFEGAGNRKTWGWKLLFKSKFL